MRSFRSFFVFPVFVWFSFGLLGCAWFALFLVHFLFLVVFVCAVTLLFCLGCFGLFCCVSNSVLPLVLCLGFSEVFSNVLLLAGFSSLVLLLGQVLDWVFSFVLEVMSARSRFMGSPRSGHNLTLTEEELRDALVAADAWAVSGFDSSLALVGCVLTKRQVNWDAFVALVTKLWSSTLGWKFVRLELIASSSLSVTKETERVLCLRGYGISTNT